jgi:hypothetical protein
MPEGTKWIKQIKLLNVQKRFVSLVMLFQFDSMCFKRKFYRTFFLQVVTQPVDTGTQTTAALAQQVCFSFTAVAKFPLHNKCVFFLRHAGLLCLMIYWDAPIVL